ncbi:TetR/AcrR family transcriptional regulator [Williamsia deligens]|uniref:TetR/AcrR family transcriptional regulator n=1 Tax=Williamsia deligens TaxID=321325 RepID=A0ABW3G5K5_9NOCA|nr:TetR/AcrR family transcriptional regulator [Williamsia deligens]MCP2193253.1 transcriptional regulator, TetR family [Williamsia deligens]
MPPRARRTDSLSKEAIVAAATEILDADGESALTFRALAARLSTGAGAIYWHVADKDDLLTAATTDAVDRTLTGIDDLADPREALRAIAVRVFDTVDDHPWVATHLARGLGQPGMIAVLDAIGRQVDALGVPPGRLFDTATALLSYILGGAGQNAANARLHAQDPEAAGRSAALGRESDRWASLDAERYPFVRAMADSLRDHDDREQFLAGVDLILAGIDARDG